MNFDPRPLLDPVNPAALHAFTQAQKARGNGSGQNVAGIAIAAVFGAFFLGNLLLIGGVIIVGIGVALGAAAGIGLGAWGFVVLAALVAGLVYWIIVASRRSKRAAELRAFRLATFAQANGMGYLNNIPAPALPGMIFTGGSDRKTKDAVRGLAPRFVEFGNYEYTTGSGKSQRTHNWGYVAVKLNTPLPHIVLDAVGNNSVFGTNLPAMFSKDQRLSLEGNFDQFFELSCPQGYEADALYLFTPDIMARFIDNAAALDVEIIDEWLFFYSPREFVTLDANTWAWLFSVVAAMLDKLTQWERWRDDRLALVAPASQPWPGSPSPAGIPASLPFATPAGLLRPPPGVAPQGQRLKRGFPWILIVVTGGFVLVWMLPSLIGFLAFMGSGGR